MVYPQAPIKMVIYMELPQRLGCALLQESPEFPGIRRNLGSKKNYVPFLKEHLEKAKQTTKEPSNTGSIFART
jgi:hypothetical protein